MRTMHTHPRLISIVVILADLLIALGLCIAAYYFPVAWLSVLGYVTAVSWVVGMFMIGGYNTIFLRPRRRIFISVALVIFFTALIGVFWAGNGHEWYMKGGLLSLSVMAVFGTIARMIITAFWQSTAYQIVPFRIPNAYRPLLEEIKNTQYVIVEPEIQSPEEPLPARRSGFPIYLVATDMRMDEEELLSIFPLYERAEIVDICALYELLLGKVALIPAKAGEFIMPDPLRIPSTVNGVIKRIMDLAAAIFLLPLAFLVVLISAIAVKLTSRGPVFFIQERLGRYGKPFHMYKLRTMRAGNGKDIPRWAGKDDQRITKIGRWLRQVGIDEIPQLWNILKGEMSFIGPRPECRPISEDLEKNISFFRARLLAVPGISGWGQIHQGGDSTLGDASNKLQYDLYYLKYQSPVLDFQIFLRTIQMILHLAKPAPQAEVSGKYAPELNKPSDMLPSSRQ